VKYTFRTKTEDQKIDSILLSLQGKERADFIRNALNFYIENKDIIEKIANDMAEIKEIIKNQPTSTISNKHSILQEPDNDSKKEDAEEILKELVDDFLNM
jgi:metal-responsive CopG/Arc/MetJ family transcriptional regulator